MLVSQIGLPDKLGKVFQHFPEQLVLPLTTIVRSPNVSDPVIIGVEDDSLFKQPVNSSCQMVDSVSLYLDVAGTTIRLVKSEIL